MDKNDLSIEEKIKEMVKKEYEDAPPPPLSKDETWEQIHQRLSEGQSKSKKSRSSRYMRWVGIAAAIIIIAFGLLLFQSQNGSAFGWITKYLLHSEGNQTQLRGSITESGSTPKEKPPIPSASELRGHDTEITKKLMSLSKAETATNFSIVVPTQVPDGFHLRNVTVWFVEDRKQSDKVILHYNKGQKTFIIQEEYIEHKMGFGTTVDNEDTIIKKVNINGERGTLFLFKNGSNKLIWTRMKTQMILKSKLPKDTILSVARSIRKAGT